MVRVTYHDDLKEVQADPLLAAPTARAPFDRFEWWANLCASFGILPLFALARTQRAALLLPLRRVGRRIELLTCWYSFRVQPVLCGASEDAPQLLAALARDLAGQAPHLDLSPLPDAGSLAAALRKAGWVTFAEQCDVNHILPVGGRSYADYLATRPGPLRTTLKRKAGKVEVRLLDRFDADAWAAYEAIYALSWKPSEGAPAFLRRFAEEEGAAGRLRLGLALAGGKPVAAQFWTVEAGTAFIHKLAHDEAARALSPGTTLTAALLARVIDRDRVALVDFGTGDDPYKRDWMEAVRPRYRIEAFRPLWPGNWPRIARALLRRRLAPAGHGH